MRHLQKGNQTAQRSGCRWNWFSRVLILRTLWKTDHRVPEERQASSAQDDRITAPIGFRREQGTANERSPYLFFVLLLNERCGANSFIGSWCLVDQFCPTSPFVDSFRVADHSGVERFGRQMTHDQQTGGQRYAAAWML